MNKMFNLLVASVILATAAQAHDIVLREQGKAILGVSYPADWKQLVDKNSVVATSEDGTAWSVISTLNDIKDKAAGIPKIKEGLEEYLTEIKYDETTATDGGALVLSGKGKGKESGVEVVFTSGVFQSGPERFAGIVFIVDADIEKYYEKTILAICESVLVEADFPEEPASDE